MCSEFDTDLMLDRVESLQAQVARIEAAFRRLLHRYSSPENAVALDILNSGA